MITRRHIFIIASISHIIWMALGAGISLLLVFSTGGHPPGIILLPLVLPVWIIGHGAIWGIAWLAGKGRTHGGGSSWPPVLLLALIGSGVAAAIGIIQLSGTILLGTFYPFRGVILWTATLAFWSAHGVNFAGLLLRRPWSRELSALLCVVWAAVPIWQVLDHLLRGRQIDLVAGLQITGLVAPFCALTVYLLVSKRVLAFLHRR